MTDTLDLNADLGESFGAWKMGADEAMLDIVTSANIACGFHAGDPTVMTQTIRLCLEKGVNVGAHPGFQDLQGFGRRRLVNPDLQELRASVLYQIGALQAIAASMRARVTHVKMHGSLGNMASEEAPIAQACIGAIADLNAGLKIVAMAATHLQFEAERIDAPLLREIYADRAYNDDGTLAARNQPGSVIHDPAVAADRVLRMLQEQAVQSVNGVSVPVRPQTVCVHGDSPGAIRMAEYLRTQLEKAGVRVQGY